MGSLGELRIEYFKVNDLTAYEHNSRTHADDQVDQIAGSIQEFGFVNPVLIDSENVIIAGHGRLMAAKQLGMKSVPAIRLGHLSDAQARALVIADNRLALNAGWDEAALANEIARLDGDGFDLDVLGFDASELADLLKDDALEDAEADDAAPALQKQVKTALGDIWMMEDHRLMCGDSTDSNSVEVLLGGGQDGHAVY